MYFWTLDSHNSPAGTIRQEFTDFYSWGNPELRAIKGLAQSYRIDEKGAKTPPKLLAHTFSHYLPIALNL